MKTRLPLDVSASAPLSSFSSALGERHTNICFESQRLAHRKPLPLHRLYALARQPTAPAMSTQPRRALVVYGSETGNAQDVAEEMGRLAVRLRFDTEVAELDAITLVCRPSLRRENIC
jgi:sulfite reductase alpha subunit-like flavoprotein